MHLPYTVSAKEYKIKHKSVEHIHVERITANENDIKLIHLQTPNYCSIDTLVYSFLFIHGKQVFIMRESEN